MNDYPRWFIDCYFDIDLWQDNTPASTGAAAAPEEAPDLLPPTAIHRESVGQGRARVTRNPAEVTTRRIRAVVFSALRI